MPRFIVLCTDDYAQLARAVAGELRARGHDVSSSLVTSSADLSAAVLRSGKGNTFDAAIVTGSCDRAVLPFVTQVRRAAWGLLLG
jgi:gamma-glutamyltranspeptidase